jgi:hypothetical protein
MGNSWQSDFLTIVGTSSECGAFAFELHIRQLILDVAVIENMTPQTIVLDGLVCGLTR